MSFGFVSVGVGDVVVNFVVEEISLDEVELRGEEMLVVDFEVC